MNDAGDRCNRSNSEWQVDGAPEHTTERELLDPAYVFIVDEDH